MTVRAERRRRWRERCSVLPRCVLCCLGAFCAASVLGRSPWLPTINQRYLLWSVGPTAQIQPGHVMHCFTHEGTAAVGVCGQCGKGICRSCTVDLAFRLVCSENCANLARNSDALAVSVEQKWGVGGGKPKLPVPVLMFGLFGTIFLCFALYNFLVVQRNDWFGAVFGSACIFMALLSHRRWTSRLQ